MTNKISAIMKNKNNIEDKNGQVINEHRQAASWSPSRCTH